MSKCLVLIAERARIEEQGLEFSYLDARDLMPVVILCAISILLSVLWLLVIAKYTASKRDNV